MAPGPGDETRSDEAIRPRGVLLERQGVVGPADQDPNPNPIGIGLPQVSIFGSRLANIERTRRVHRSALALHHPITRRILLLQKNTNRDTDSPMDQNGLRGPCLVSLPTVLLAL